MNDTKQHIVLLSTRYRPDDSETICPPADGILTEAYRANAASLQPTQQFSNIPKHKKLSR